MSWQDIYLDRQFDKAEIAAALVKAFAVHEVDILMVYQPPTLADYAGQPLLMCRVEKLTGQFPTHLEIFVLREALIPQTPLQTEIALCKALKCRALISNEDINPYTWLLIAPDGTITSVKVDADHLDQD